MHLHQSLADGQSQAQAAELARDAAFGLLEGVKDACKGVSFDAFAAVADFDYDVPVAIGSAMDVAPCSDAPAK